MDQQTKHELLNTDFAQTQEMLRHYDTVNWDVVKFAFAQLAIAIGACWHIYSNIKIETEAKSMTMCGMICIASFLFLLCSIWIIGRNRLYFVKSSRYLNEIRQTMLSTKPLGLKNVSGYYCNPAYPQNYDVWSTQLMCLHMFALLAGGVFACILYFFIPNICQSFLITSGIVVVVLIELATICLIKDNGKKNR